MSRRRLLIAVLLLAAWLLLGWTQYREYRGQCELARAVLAGQAAALRNAVVGAIRSHRRMGRFLQEQLQSLSDELVRSNDVLAAAVTTADGKRILSSGSDAPLGPLATAPGEYWDPAGFRLVSEFDLPPDTAGPSGPGGLGGPGGGRGWGRGRWQDPQSQTAGPLAAGGPYRMILVLDRGATDALCLRAARVQSLVFAAGTAALIAIALAWRGSVRLVAARGQAQVLQSEAGHLRALGQAAAGLAHETRNPLGLVRGWAQRLAASNLPTSEQREQALAVVEECDRVTARINQFLAFARPCAPSLEPVDVEQLLAELAVLLEPDLEAKGVRLDRSAIAKGQVIQADRDLLRQAVFNLVQNALHFAPHSSAVEITLRPGDNGSLRLQVADRGPGVPDQAVPSLFTPYFTTRAGGTGLGLAIVRQIAAAHGWHSGYTARSGGGAVFWLDGIHG